MGTLSTLAMENPPKDIYPPSIGHMRLEDVKAELALPADVEKDIDVVLIQRIKDTYKFSSDSLKLCALYSLKEMADEDKRLWKNFDSRRIPISATKKYKTWLPSLVHLVASNLSSLGYDPYTAPERSNPEVIEKAFAFEPTIQNITRGIAQRLLAKFNKDKKEPVRALASWLYPLDSSKPLDDRYYLPIEEAIPVGYKFLPYLNEEERTDFFANFDLTGFKEAIHYISFAFPDEYHMVVNPADYSVILPDTESPNNEGLGDHKKYGKAILGTDAKDLEKAHFNIDNWYDGGRRTFETVLKKYCPQRIDEWNKLYEKKESSIK